MGPLLENCSQESGALQHVGSTCHACVATQSESKESISSSALHTQPIITCISYKCVQLICLVTQDDAETSHLLVTHASFEGHSSPEYWVNKVLQLLT